MRQFRDTCVMCLVVAFLLGGSLQAATPPGAASAPPSAAPKVDIPTAALDGTLLPDHETQIKARLKYFVDLIRSAKDTDQAKIDTARDGLVKTYAQYDSFAFQYSVAKHAVQIVGPLLTCGSRIKETNAAIALSQMTQVPIDAALRQMVAHASPAVRYLGWRGYGPTWSSIAAQGSTHARTLFYSLGLQADKETSAPVMAMVWDVLRLRGTVPLGSLVDPRKEGLNIIRRSWRKHCRRVMAGDLAMSDAARGGLATVVDYAATAWGAGDKPRAKEAAQLAADLLWCAGHAYANAAAQEDEEAAAPALNAAKALLWECEKALNGLMGRQVIGAEKHLGFVLTDPSLKTLPDRGKAIMLHMDQRTNKTYGVYPWLDELKKRFGIETPTKAMFDTPTTSTSPATRPASG